MWVVWVVVKDTNTAGCFRLSVGWGGQAYAFFDGLPAARVTDCTPCGSILTKTAMSSVQINGQGGAANEGPPRNDGQG